MAGNSEVRSKGEGRRAAKNSVGKKGKRPEEQV